jgi:hypothetical protein
MFESLVTFSYGIFEQGVDFVLGHSVAFGGGGGILQCLYDACECSVHVTKTHLLQAGFGRCGSAVQAAGVGVEFDLFVLELVRFADELLVDMGIEQFDVGYACVQASLCPWEVDIDDIFFSH